MKYVIYGAGGVGGTIGARLAQAGYDVCLIARGAHAEVIQQQGLTYVHAAGRVSLPIPCVTHPRDVAALRTGEPCVVFMCMKAQHMQSALGQLAAVAGDVDEVHVVCAQNGVVNERWALRRFASVYATVVNLPAGHLKPGEVTHYTEGAGGILDTGCYPHGQNQIVTHITNALTQAGFSARPDPQVMRQKYAKLLLNLGNIVQAAVEDAQALRAFSAQMRDEARQCYVAAGIDCASSEEVRERARGVFTLATSLQQVSGSTWQSLARGADGLETEYLNGEITLLGRLHGVSTPANNLAVQLGRELLAAGRGPGIFTPEQVLDRLAQHGR